MNQILLTENKKNRYSEVNLKKVVKFFCVLLIIFGIILAAMGIYYMHQNKPKPDEIEEINKPEATLEQRDDSIVITAKYDEGISRIIYYWDSNDIKELNVDGKTYIEKAIDMPEEYEGILVAQIIGIDGSTTELTKEIVLGDNIKPEIEWTVTTNVSVVATDETEISYLAYKWNDEEEVVIHPTEDNKTTITTEITIKRGTNELTIKAVDKAGNIQTKTKTFKGINEPDISMLRYGNQISITVTHDMGIKKITYTINDAEYTYDETSEGYDETATEVKKTFTIPVGKNYVKVVAYSNEDSQKTKEAMATYNP